MARHDATRQPLPMNRLIHIDKAAARTNYSRRTLERRIEAGKLTPHKRRIPGKGMGTFLERAQVTALKRGVA